MSAGIEKPSHTWEMLCHLSALSGFIGIPFGHLLGPLFVWLLKRNEMPEVDEQGKESLNFQISMTIYGFVALLLAIVIVGIFLAIALLAVDVIFVVIASVRTSEGRDYRYPLTIRFLK